MTLCSRTILRDTSDDDRNTEEWEKTSKLLKQSAMLPRRDALHLFSTPLLRKIAPFVGSRCSLVKQMRMNYLFPISSSFLARSSERSNTHEKNWLVSWDNVISSMAYSRVFWEKIKFLWKNWIVFPISVSVEIALLHLNLKFNWETIVRVWKDFTQCYRKKLRIPLRDFFARAKLITTVTRLLL